MFTSGSTVKTKVCVDIAIEDDKKLEDDEHFTFSLTSNHPVVFFTNNGTVKIADNDSKLSSE